MREGAVVLVLVVLYYSTVPYSYCGGGGGGYNILARMMTTRLAQSLGNVPLRLGNSKLNTVRYEYFHSVPAGNHGRSRAHPPGSTVLVL